ncbi:cytochrome P450 307a1 [Cephus cinctus]|uniref:Cytochrome P450 307a1 n=1 Tax=Cephus cinctus TaxID=211228 RepID=A0AAJ7C3F5_CEPCN|nr:cytochrome P450 307a1 [Cephus cinctus]
MDVGAFWILFTCATILAMIARNRLRSGPTEEEGDTVAWEKGKLRKEKDQADDIKKDKRAGRMKKLLNGPRALPLFGSLHLLASPGGPFEAFTRLARKYGDIYEIRLGVATCVVVSSYSLVKEVLITKGSHFGGRPDFLRFHQLFGGDRNNSLALCDWSDLQMKRRSLARSFCSPRRGSPQQEELSRVATLEASQFMSALTNEESQDVLRGERSLKPLLLGAVANMFTRYMCSTRFSYADQEFCKIVRTFDEIFWDINQGYAVDFLPWLRPFYAGHMKRLNNWATGIRTFILKRIIDRHRASLDSVNGVPRDFTDALLLHLESPGSGLSWEHIIFELEDFLGGHSAIGNLVMLILANSVVHSEVQSKIQAECDTVLSQPGRSRALVTLEDRADMPYTESVIWETLRISSSPIVPHVATQDTEIGGYNVAKDTVVFVNNYELNLGESYWGPGSREFRPERFLKYSVPEAAGDSGEKPKVRRPEHFVPFSTGKRTCIGQRLVQGFTFVLVTALFSRFDISQASEDLASRLLPGCVAVPPDPFHLVLVPRAGKSDD